jgi:hypothetical protein
MKLTSLSEIQEYVEKENHKKYFSFYNFIYISIYSI